MSFLILIIWLTLFVLQPLTWPMLGTPPTFPLTALSIALSFAVFMASSKKKYLEGQFWILVAFMGIIVVSGLFNGWLGGGVQQARTFLLTAFLPFVLFSNHAISENKTRIIMFLSLVFALFMVSNGLSQLASVNGQGWAGSFIARENRITFAGILEDPNDLGGYFVMCLPFAAFFASNARLSISRLLCFGIFMIIGYGIILTNSRGTLLASMGVLVTYVYYRYGRKKSILVGLALLPLVLFLFSQFRAIEVDSSAMGRADTWYAGLQLLEQNPLFGVGKGNFLDYAPITAHNSLVLVMSELGFIGYILWFSVILISLFKAGTLLVHHRNNMLASGWKATENTELLRALKLNTTIVFALLGYLFSAFFLSRSYSAFLFILCGLASASYTRIVIMQPDLAIDKNKNWVKLSFTWAFVSIAGMYSVVRLLL